MDGTTLQRRVFELLEDFRGSEPLKRLFWSVLGYDRRDDPLSRRGWPETASGALAEDPTILASGGAGDGFEVIYCRLAGRLLLEPERRVISKLLSDGHDRALFVFSDRDRERWHLVNVRYGEARNRPLLRRITVGPEEEHRTASERIAMLDLDSIAENVGKDVEELAPLEIQSRHDEAFNVEAVTKKFFDEYARVFACVEGLVEGIAEPERKRLFAQRLFNRLMFLAFIQKKGWLKFGERKDYLPALWEAYRQDAYDDNFYRDRLKVLFFAGLNTPNEVDVRGINEGGFTREIIGDVPYLNGGLFERDPDGTDDEDSAVVVPDEAIRGILFDLFGKFNFTVTESTPLDVEVAVDPEMLGRVFEELVTGRHETGSYYTPKPVVSFMCREALKGHLGAELPGDSPEEIRGFVEDHAAEDLRNPEKALEALQNVRVCDPACGSGAYLLGMLHELLDLRASLFVAKDLDDRSTYDRKLEIIQRNLYGVDIDPFAVNIARLRLWLSLVVDYEGDDPPPLPNLDFKIEAGDSLTTPGPAGEADIDIFRKDQIDEFFALKTTYLKAHGEEKKRLRKQIEDLRDRIAEWAQHDGDAESLDWQVEFAEVFADGGFDVVLANPPYVRMELFKEIKPTLRRNFPEVHSDRADLYVYFYGRALQLLKDGGMLVFISSNKWFRAGYGAKLRKLVADTTHVATITDFCDLPVFQSASAYPMIFVAQKERDTDRATTFTQAKSLEPPYPDVAALIRERGQPLPPDALNGSDWSLTDATTAVLLSKMRAAGIPLGEYAKGQIYYGVKTGLNQAFVIDGRKRDELISQDPESANLIKPFLTGKNIRKWNADTKDKWLLYTYHGIDVSGMPGVIDHLEPFREDLEGRATRQEWYELQQPQMRYASAFERPKLVFPDIAKKPRFALDGTGAYSGDTTFLIPVDDPYLLGLLNSSVVEDYFVQVGATVRGGYLRFKRQYVEQIPIPSAPAADREAIAELVQKCLDAKGVGCEEWEKEIDERVATLYGL